MLEHRCNKRQFTNITVCTFSAYAKPIFVLQWWAMKLSTEAVATILRVDQIIMAKQAGGPKPRQGPADEED